MSSDRSMDRSLVIPDNTIDDSPVSAVYTVLFDLFRNKNMTLIIFADDQGTCGIHINTVYDSRTYLAIDTGKTVPAVIHNRIDQRTAVMSC